ncbi:MAG: hypothetical protein H6865_03520 [Rhodospirillales bacterium]|nr:hypothetical protein [Alphaproteobacteria bacterium]MCB9986686.1 hypothetical protein [Rhodospirillales bacterium]USO06788.1 MAG: hypothetical protein H6866_04865 [Rhodospirillales bacterium]
MPYQIAPNPFNIASGGGSAVMVHIEDMRAGERYPVGFLSLEKDMPVDTGRLAANIADFLNGKNPTWRGVWRGGEPRVMHFQRLPENGAIIRAVRFSFHAGHDAETGVSLGNGEAGALLTLTPDYSDRFTRRFHDNREGWALVMESGSQEERRVAPRFDGDGESCSQPVPRPNF